MIYTITLTEQQIRRLKDLFIKGQSSETAACRARNYDIEDMDDEIARQLRDAKPAE